jgi:hypothetical protein
MSSLLALIFVGTSVGVVFAIWIILWRARRSKRDGRVAMIAGVLLALWCAFAIGLAYRGFFHPAAPNGIPPIGINMAVAFSLLGLALWLSPSLRGLLTNQTALIRLHAFRILGFVFLILMVLGRVPGLWALPAGVGDMLIGAAAFPVARRLQTPSGRRRAVLFNVLGMTDLIVAIALGVTTNPGPLQIFRTIPTSEMLTTFPLVLVPAFLVPLAFTLHVVSLWQLLGLRWAAPQISEKDTEGVRASAGFHAP